MNLSLLFKNKHFLDQALTHRSYLNEHKDISTSNERLEFLGDAVLELVITQHLYDEFPTKHEGELTALRSALVKTQTLGQVGHKLNLGNLLKISRGEEQSGGRENLSLLANTLEAVIGGLYFDGGLPAAKNLIEAHITSLLPTIIANKLYQPSYISLEKALSYYNIIPETVYSITSVTAKSTREFETPRATFSYQTIKPEAYTGYNARNIDGFIVLFAQAEKALADYLYFVDLKKVSLNDRLMLKNIKRSKLTSYVRLFKRQGMLKLIDEIYAQYRKPRRIY